MTQPAITTTDLCFSYEKTPILQKISFSVEKGSFIGIIGPNGGGKTTLLKLLLGFLTPDEGAVFLSGKPPKEMREKIGYVPQNRGVDRDFPITVFELILSGKVSSSGPLGRYPQEVREKAEELLEKMGLQEHRKKAFGSLSGGLAQRALIARCLLSDPDYLFLDEPTANVDPAAAQGIFDLISPLKGEKTILMVTHHITTVLQRIDKILCVEKEITSYLPKDLCEHFTMGLYHPPLL